MRSKLLLLRRQIVALHQMVIGQQTRFVRFARATQVAAAAAQRSDATSEAVVGKNAEHNQCNYDRDASINQRLDEGGESSSNIPISIIAKIHVLLQAAYLDAARARARAASRANTLRAISHLLATRG